jgi:hypothetical protein
MSNSWRVYRLYQWLSRRARFSRSDSAIGGLSRTVRTEVTFEHHRTTMVAGGSPADLDHCPLCGQRLAAAQEEHPRFCLQKDSTSQAHSPVDDAFP